MQPKEVFDKKVSFFNKSEKRLDKIAIKIQKAIWRKLEPLLLLLDDEILTDESTVKILAKIEQEVFKEYKLQITKATDQVIKDFGKINKINDDYFSIYSTGKEFSEGKAISQVLLSQRLGVRGDKLLRDGFLRNFIDNPDVLNKIKSQTLKAVTGNVSREVLTNRLRETIVTTNTPGIAQSQLSRYITDTYTQFDSITQQVRSEKMGMRVAMYQNSLIQTSRCFCRERFNKAFTIEEMKQWKASTRPSQTKDGSGCKAIYESGSYNPLIHRGGYNCRHVLRYISKPMAIRLRPELKAYYDDLDRRGVRYI